MRGCKKPKALKLPQQPNEKSLSSTCLVSISNVCTAILWSAKDYLRLLTLLFLLLPTELSHIFCFHASRTISLTDIGGCRLSFTINHRQKTDALNEGTNIRCRSEDRVNCVGSTIVPWAQHEWLLLDQHYIMKKLRWPYLLTSLLSQWLFAFHSYAFDL